MHTVHRLNVHVHALAQNNLLCMKHVFVCTYIYVKACMRVARGAHVCLPRCYESDGSAISAVMNMKEEVGMNEVKVTQHK
jgi:hypothetical protein